MDYGLWIMDYGKQLFIKKSDLIKIHWNFCKKVSFVSFQTE